MAINATTAPPPFPPTFWTYGKAFSLHIMHSPNFPKWFWGGKGVGYLGKILNRMPYNLENGREKEGDCVGNQIQVFAPPDSDYYVAKIFSESAITKT